MLPGSEADLIVTKKKYVLKGTQTFHIAQYYKDRLNVDFTDLNTII